MTRSLFIVAATLFTHLAFAQTQKCIMQADSNKVISIAKEWDIYWNDFWVCPHKLTLDTLNCSWTLVTCKTEHTKKGNCKYTNGCTIWITATLMVDAYGRMTSIEKNERVFHNYE